LNLVSGTIVFTLVDLFPLFAVEELFPDEKVFDGKEDLSDDCLLVESDFTVDVIFVVFADFPVLPELVAFAI